MTSNGISNSQIIVRIPTATAPDDETVTTGETTLELALTRRYLEQLSCGATSDLDNSDSGEVEDTIENASKDSGDSQQHRKPSRRRHHRASQRRKITNWQRDQMPTTAEGQQTKNQQLFKDAKPRVATARLTRQVLQPDLLLSNCDPSTVAPAPGYFLLAPRLGERGLLEWRRRLWLQRQTEQRTDLGKLNENAKLRCQLGQQLAVTGECFQPRLGGAVTSSDFASANVVEHQQQEERDRQGYSQDATLTTRTSMASRPATAAVSSKNRQLPPQSRRIQQQQQHPAAKSNGHSTTDRKLLRSLNSHPPNQSTPPGSSHSFGRPRFSPYTPPLSSSMPITRRSARIRHATVSTDADITDPRIYPTELSSSRDQRQAQAAAMSRSYDCAFFSAGANSRGHGRRGEFIINPEWLSESVSIERLRINERPLIMPTGAQQQQQQQLQHQHSLPSNWPKRCRSAPPPKQQQQQQNLHQSSINPITWQ